MTLSCCAVRLCVAACLVLAVAVTPCHAASWVKKKWWNPTASQAPVFQGAQFYPISEKLGFTGLAGSVVAFGDFNSDTLFASGCHSTWSVLLYVSLSAFFCCCCSFVSKQHRHLCFGRAWCHAFCPSLDSWFVLMCFSPPMFLSLHLHVTHLNRHVAVQHNLCGHCPSPIPCSQRRPCLHFPSQ